jgi:hypothetical protein
MAAEVLMKANSRTEFVLSNYEKIGVGPDLNVFHWKTMGFQRRRQ